MLIFALLAWRAWPGITGILLGVGFVGAASGTYQIPVAIYLLCLYSMAFMACRVEDQTGLLWLGAMLFVIADSLIGVNKFAMPFAYAVPVIVATYFMGQTLIGVGVLGLGRKSAQ